MAALCAALAALATVLALSRPPLGRPPPRAVARPGPGGSVADAALHAPGLLHVVAAAGAAVTALLLLPGVLGVVGAAAAALVVWRRSRHWEGAAARRRRARLESDLPHVVDLMVAALAAGAAPAEALLRVAAAVEGPTATELGGWVTRLRLGADPVGVWAAMAGHPELGRLGTALHRAADSGAPVAATLSRLAEDLRARRRADVETRVRQVEVKAAVPLGICLLPSFLLVGVVPLVAGSAMGLLSR